MQSGKLDRRIAFQTSTLSVNSIGEWIPTWTTSLILWASIEYRYTAETFEASERVAPNEVIFRTRYSATINEKMRIIYSGCQYDILHLETINRNEGLKITAVKKDSAPVVTGDFSAQPDQTLTWTDGITSFRYQVRSGVLYLDKTLTVTGFTGVESTDDGVTGDWITLSTST